MTESQQPDDTNQPDQQGAEASSTEPQPTAPKPAPSAAAGPTPAGPAPSPAVMAVRPRSVIPPKPILPGAGVTPDHLGAVDQVGSVHAVGPMLSELALAEARKYGRADEEGNVFLFVRGEEIHVGQYPGADPDAALNYFARKFDELSGQIALLSQRIEAKAPSVDMPKTLAHLRRQLAERNFVGDVAAAEARLDELEIRITDLQEAERAAQEAAKAAELKARESLVIEAESLANQDPERTQWKASSVRMSELFDAWKAAQRSGVRLSRSAEDALWKRFRAAQTTFDRHRRAFFSQLDTANAEARRVKERLIAEAEALSSSTDWGATAGEYRRLMDCWKAAPRGSKKDDDALWARFRAAQDVFFSARQAANDALDREYSANLVVKEQLLAEANALLPVKDLNSVRRQLQSIRDRWEKAGKVPRGDVQRMESGLRSVEDAVRDAEYEHWKRTDPEARARTHSALSQLESSIAALQEDLAAAQAKGDARKIKKAEEALSARRAWLEQIRKSAGELG